MDPDRTCTRPGGTVITALRCVVLIASVVVAAMVTHDLIWLLGQTPVALILGIPCAFLFARWIVWVRSLSAPPPQPQPQPQSLTEAVSR
jgi:hypothetical protein